MQNRNLEAALKYHTELGFSVIPVGAGNEGKKPFVEWAKYQNEKATSEQLKEWWKQWPRAKVAIITGAISGLDVVDVDSEAGLRALDEHLPDSLVTPIAKTPGGGWHYYFEHREGLSNAVRFLTDCDIRTNGGYIIAPPSKGINGIDYTWLNDLSIQHVRPAPMPIALYNIFLNKVGERGDAKPLPLQSVTGVTNRYINFEQGNRDNALFHITNCLVKGGMPSQEIQQFLAVIASKLCNPPFPSKEISAKIQSALKRAQSRERSLSKEILEWVSVTERYFSVTDCDRELQTVTKEQKGNRRVIFHRLVKEGVLERDPKREGFFRGVLKECEPMDFLNAETETLNLALPFGISEMVETMPEILFWFQEVRTAARRPFY